MRFGFHFLDFTLPGYPGTLAGHLSRTAKAADAVGASWLTVMDHFLQMEGFQTAHDPMLEGYTTLGLPGGVDRAREARHRRHGRDLPASGTAGEDT